LRKAQSFVTGAELALGVGDDPLLDLPGVAAALAVLALHDRHRSERDHRLGATTHHLRQRDRRRMTRTLQSPAGPGEPR